VDPSHVLRPPVPSAGRLADCCERLINRGIDDHLDHLAVADRNDLAVRLWLLAPLRRMVDLNQDDDPVARRP